MSTCAGSHNDLSNAGACGAESTDHRREAYRRLYHGRQPISFIFQSVQSSAIIPAACSHLVCVTDVHNRTQKSTATTALLHGINELGYH